MTFMGESSKCPRVETIGIGSFLLPQISWWWPHNQWQHLQPWPPHPMSFMLKITKNNKNQGSAAKRTTYVFHFLLSLPWFSRSGLNIKRNFLTDGWETLERIVQWRNYTAENLLKTTSYWKKKKPKNLSIIQFTSFPYGKFRKQTDTKKKYIYIVTPLKESSLTAYCILFQFFFPCTNCFVCCSYYYRF